MDSLRQKGLNLTVYLSVCLSIYLSISIQYNDSRHKLEGLFQLFDGLQTVLESGLIGLGMQKAASRIKLLTMLVVRLGGAYVSLTQEQVCMSVCPTPAIEDRSDPFTFQFSMYLLKTRNGE